MSSQVALSRLSQRLFQESGGLGRRIPEPVLDRDYCMSNLLIALSQNDFKDTLAFKGGTLLKHCYYIDFRFSQDLDFTSLNENVKKDRILLGFSDVFEAAYEIGGIVYEFMDDIQRSDRQSL